MAKSSSPKNSHGYASAHVVRVPLWPYLVTPIAAVVAMPATFFAHRAWGASPEIAVLLTVSAVTIVGFTWLAARPRGALMQAMATAVAVLGSAWVIAAVIGDPTKGALPVLWLVGAFTASVVVAVRRMMAEGSNGDSASGWDAVTERVKELRGIRAGRATVKGAKVSASLTAEPGQTIAEVAKARGQIASVADVSAQQVRIVQSPDSERRGRVEIVTSDQLRVPRPWEGPSRPGGSIAEPILLGVVEDSEPLELYLPGDRKRHRNATHVAVVGMTGAGKTEVILRIAEEVCSRFDAEMWVGDARKAGQMPDWFRRAAARLATSEDAVDGMLDDLLAEVPKRSAQMGSHGCKEWTRGCRKCPRYRVVVLDEAAQVAAGNKIFVDLSESLRSVGVSLLVGLQRATYDRFPTSARANIGVWICLGVNKEDDAEAALSEQTLEAGAMPWRWKNGFPGYCYAELNHVDAERWAMQCRSFAPPPSEDERADALAPFLRPIVPGGTAAAAAPAERPDDAPERPRRSGRGPDGWRPEDDDVPNEAVDQDDPPDDVDPAEPVEVPDESRRFELGDGEPEMSPREARDELRTYLFDLADAGKRRVTATDLTEILVRTRRGGSWLRTQLSTFTQGENPLLRRTERGYYDILVPEDVNAG